MKTGFSLTILFGLLIALTIAAPPSPEEKMKVMNECKEQEKASDEDVSNLMAHKLPEGPNGKCLMACIQEKIGFVKDGKVNADFMKAMPEGSDEKKPPKPMVDAFNACTGVTAPERCELSFKLAECMHKEFQTNGPK